MSGDTQTEAERHLGAAIDPLSEPMLDIPGAARLLNIKPETVEKLARARKIPNYRVGGGRGVVRFSPPELRAWLAARRVPGERAAS